MSAQTNANPNVVGVSGALAGAVNQKPGANQYGQNELRRATQRGEYNMGESPEVKWHRVFTNSMLLASYQNNQRPQNSANDEDYHHASPEAA